MEKENFLINWKLKFSGVMFHYRSYQEMGVKSKSVVKLLLCSDWSINSFILVVYKDFFHIQSKFSVQKWLKNFRTLLWDYVRTNQNWVFFLKGNQGVSISQYRHRVWHMMVTNRQLDILGGGGGGYSLINSSVKSHFML